MHKLRRRQRTGTLAAMRAATLPRLTATDAHLQSGAAQLITLCILNCAAHPIYLRAAHQYTCPMAAATKTLKSNFSIKRMDTEMSSTNKTVIVTGASSGIGFAVAQAYLKRGYNVVGNGRTLERLQAAAAKLGNPANFLLVEGDIAKPATAKALFSRAIAAFGKVDILINNAGMVIAKPVASYTEEDVDTIVGTNLKGFFYPSQAAAEHMTANRQGHIVNITASVMNPNAKLQVLLPVLTKGGLNEATRGLAIELAAANVKVNAVAPGIIETPLHGDGFADSKAFLNSLAPSGTTGSVQDVVNAVLYLTDSNFTTGTVLPVDGGSSAGTW
jgi:NAD(P)-dependent dehydrogenase (short-subunit alcohol dehydrogenase family)